MNVPWQDHKLGFIGSYHPHHLLSLIARIQNNDFWKSITSWPAFFLPNIETILVLTSNHRHCQDSFTTILTLFIPFDWLTGRHCVCCLDQWFITVCLLTSGYQEALHQDNAWQMSLFTRNHLVFAFWPHFDILITYWKSFTVSKVWAKVLLHMFPMNYL